MQCGFIAELYFSYNLDIADRDPEEVMDGEKVEDIIVYINRLSTAKKRVDKRISTLSGEQFDFVSVFSPFYHLRSHPFTPAKIHFTVVRCRLEKTKHCAIKYRLQPKGHFNKLVRFILLYGVYGSKR